MKPAKFFFACLASSTLIHAQEPASPVDAILARQPAGSSLASASSQGVPIQDLSSRESLPGNQETSQEVLSRTQEQERILAKIREAKLLEKGPKRFGADLFDVRQVSASPTEGGISEDYVLGVGDRLRLNLFGSATQEMPLQVDGRGSLVIPRVGRVSVAGLPLAKARAVVENKVRELFSRTTVDLSVTKLREVRVFVLGEVYAPGSFLIPNLSSLVNVLGLAGGPTPTGSFREIRVVRGGKVVQTVDLYPLRAEGLGNFNFGFQNGDTVFVPLVKNQVRLEGAFTRVAATVAEARQTDGSPEMTLEQKSLLRRIRSLERRLGQPETTDQEILDGGKGFAPERRAAPGSSKGAENPMATTLAGKDLQAAGLVAQAERPALDLTPAARTALEDDLDYLREQLALSRRKDRSDFRLSDDAAVPDELKGQPQWIVQWLKEGRAPAMLFEMVPGETVQDALRFAGGFAFKGMADSVTLRRLSSQGSLDALDIPAKAMGSAPLERGDVLTALPLRDAKGRSVLVSGWARTLGVFARQEGDRAGSFIARNSLLLPDTYLERGELVRTLSDGSRQFRAFNVARAVKGEDGDSPELQDRDEIVLYRIGDVRLPLTLTVTGPLTRPGTFEFLKGMRVSDLLFRAGVPLRQADRFVAELARVREGKDPEIHRLDLTRLVSTENASPVDLKDDALNPLLEPFDQLSVYAKTDFKLHRTINLQGQVVRPGVYEVDSPKTTLRDIIARAGGLTADAMPSAGVFLRSLKPIDDDLHNKALKKGTEVVDPTNKGLNEVLERLNETKRLPTTGLLMTNPLLHGLAQGDLNRLVVNIPKMLEGDPNAQVEMLDGDEIIIPRKTDVAYVVGETASPFAVYKVTPGMTVRDMLRLAGGPTRNADTWNIRLMKADGRIIDRWVNSKLVEPGDALLVPQRIRRDTNWQENLAALTPLAILVNTLK